MEILHDSIRQLYDILTPVLAKHSEQGSAGGVGSLGESAASTSSNFQLWWVEGHEGHAAAHCTVQFALGVVCE
jgi:hypothetical protein